MTQNNPNGLLGNTSMPTYVKIVATGILASTYFAALIAATQEILTNTPMPSVVSLILGTGLSMAIGALGVHQGATLMESSPPPVPPVQLPPNTTMTTTTTTNGGTDNASPSAP